METNLIQNIDNNPFFTNEQSVMHTPTMFMIDFKSILNHSMPINSQLFITAQHRLILLEPFMAKEFLKILAKNIERYEKAYGEIIFPKQFEIGEKNSKKVEATSKTDVSYMG